MVMIDRPLRFCMITTFYPPYNFGGDGVFVQRLSNELARRNHQVEVIHCIDTYRLLAHQYPAENYKDPSATANNIACRRKVLIALGDKLDDLLELDAYRGLR
jgi:hypothetical protein